MHQKGAALEAHTPHDTASYDPGISMETLPGKGPQKAETSASKRKKQFQKEKGRVTTVPNGWMMGGEIVQYCSSVNVVRGGSA
jgi:hypothetical protein